MSTVRFENLAALLLAAIGLVALIPAAMVFLPDDGLEERQSRPLAPSPQISLLISEPSTYFTEFSDWFGDRVGLNIVSAGAVNSTRYYLFGTSPAANVIQNGRFSFLSRHNASGTGYALIEDSCPDRSVWSAQVERYDQNWQDLLAAAEAGGYRLFGFLVPSKPLVYFDQLPATVPPELRERCAQQWTHLAPLTQLAALNADSVVYPLELFLENRSVDHFYPPENFHFHGMSAYLASMELLNLAGLESDCVTSDFRSEPGRADMAGLFGFDRPITIAEPFCPNEELEIIPSILEHVRNYVPAVVAAIGISNPHLPDGRRALVIGDSFGPYAAPYLALGYAEVQVLNTNFLTPVQAAQIFSSYMAAESFDDLIVLDYAGAMPEGRWAVFAEGVALAGGMSRSATPGEWLRPLIGDLEQPFGAVVSQRFASMLAISDWYSPTEFGVWSISGRVGRISIPNIEELDQRNIELRFTYIAQSGLGLDNLQVRVCSQDRPDLAEQIISRANDGWIDVGRASGCGATLEIEVTTPDLPSPKEMGVGLDERPLGVALQSVRLRRQPN